MELAACRTVYTQNSLPPQSTPELVKYKSGTCGFLLCGEDINHWPSVYPTDLLKHLREK